MRPSGVDSEHFTTTPPAMAAMNLVPYLSFKGQCAEAFRMGADAPADQCQQPQCLSVSIQIAKAAGPRFGTPWMVNCEKAA